MIYFLANPLNPMLRRLRLREQDNFDRLLRSISLVENRRNNRETEKISTSTENQTADKIRQNNEEERISMLSPELKNRKRNEILDRQRFENFARRKNFPFPEQKIPNRGYKKIYEEPFKNQENNNKEEAIKTALKDFIEKMELRFPKKILVSAITRSFGLGDPIQIGHFDENTIKDIIRATFGGSPDVWNALPRGARKLVRNLRCELIGVLGRAPNEKDLIENIEVVQNEVIEVEEPNPDTVQADENDNITFDIPNDFKVLDARLGKESAWIACKLQARDKYNLANIETHFRPSKPQENPKKIRVYLKKLDNDKFGIYLENFGDTCLRLNIDSYLWDRDNDTTEKLKSEQLEHPFSIDPGQRIRVAIVDPSRIALRNCSSVQEKYDLRLHFKPI